MTAYYNEHDKYAAAWLRNLIAAGHIAPGDVDERSIEDVRPGDLAGYTQCHFFAGIGVWSYALRRAGWPDSRQVWTGSCPCQPFSQAGQGDGFADERHLWPAFYHLIQQCGPRVVFGEQVASKDGLAWLDLVQADLEAADYANGALDLCAAGFGAPHIRQRLYWLAYAADARRHEQPLWHDRADGWAPAQSGRLRAAGILADDDEHGRQGRTVEAVFGAGRWQEGDAAGRSGASLAWELGDADSAGSLAWRQATAPARHGSAAVADGRIDDTGPTNGAWRNADWLFCRDGKWRPVRPGAFPLAHGAPSRVGRLRAYGNAIVAAQAEEFIGAFLDTELSGLIA